MFLKLCLLSRLGREFFAGKASPGLEVSKVGCTAGQEKASTNFCLFFSSLCCAVLSHSVAEVKQQASSWLPLLAKRCHSDTQVFLCSLFAPVCLDRPIYPCRSLCEAVRAGCAPLMEAYGFPWPEMLHCHKFPLDNDLCIAVQFGHLPATAPPGSAPAPAPCAPTALGYP